MRSFVVFLLLSFLVSGAYGQLAVVKISDARDTAEVVYFDTAKNYLEANPNTEVWFLGTPGWVFCIHLSSIATRTQYEWKFRAQVNNTINPSSFTYSTEVDEWVFIDRASPWLRISLTDTASGDPCTWIVPNAIKEKIQLSGWNVFADSSGTLHLDRTAMLQGTTDGRNARLAPRQGGHTAFAWGGFKKF